MGLYNISAMAAILGMEISWFSNSTREIHQRVFRIKIAKIWWSMATGERLHRSWIYKLAHCGHIEYANQLIFKLDQDNLSEIVEKKIAKNIGDWRVFTLILEMQISPWRPCLIRKLADFRT